MTPILYAIALAVFCFGAAELAARVYIRRGRYYPWTPDHSVDMHLHPDLHIGDQKVVRIRTNALGERGDPVPADPRTCRVLIAGGSAVECYYLDQANTWSAALQAELSRPQVLARLNAPQVHVGNVGRSSADSRVVQIVLNRIAANYPRKLDALIIMVGASDILRWLEWGAPDGWEGDTSIPLAAFLEVNPEVPFGWTPRTLALAELHRRTRALKPESRANVGKSLLRARRYRCQSKNIIDRLETDRSRVFTRFRHYLDACLRDASKLAHHVILVNQPYLAADHYTPELTAGFWNGSIGDPFVTEPKAFYSPRLIAELMDELARHTAEVAARHDCMLVDLTGGVIPNDPRHYYDQIHFAPEGARLVGRIVAGAVQEALAGPQELATASTGTSASRRS